MNYSSLVSDLQNYLERGGSATTDPTVFNQIPRLINASERKLAQMLKILGQVEPLVNPTGLTLGQNTVIKPDRWRKTIYMRYGAGTDSNSSTPLYPRSYAYCRYYWPDDSQVKPPKFYADYGYSNWLISPTPDQTYPLEALLYMQPCLLDSANQTNFWSEYTPNALLYGALMEATPFLKNDERLPVWEKYYQNELQSLDGMDLQRILDSSAERQGLQ